MNKILASLVALLLPAIALAQTKALGPTLWDRAAYGNIPGLTAVSLEGNNGAITTSLEPLWPESATYTFLSANMSSPTISSASANDTSAGTGARTVTVTCVDSNYAVTTGTYTMNGQTGVNVTQSCMVVNKIQVATAGSGKTNAGIVYVGTGAITTGKPAVVHGLVAASAGRSTSFIYAVPDNYTLVCERFVFSNRGTTAGGLEPVIDASTNTGPFLRHYMPGFVNTAVSFFPDYALTFPEKTRLVGQILAGAGTGPAYGFANCVLISDEFAQAEF
jgi:hypothetical protein